MEIPKVIPKRKCPRCKGTNLETMTPRFAHDKGYTSTWKCNACSHVFSDY